MTLEMTQIEPELLQWLIESEDETPPEPRATEEEEETTTWSVIPSSLWFSVALCGLAGLLFGSLLYNSLLAIVGWHGLFSLGNVTFYSFWTMLGVSGGILVLGISLLLVSAARNA